MKRLLRFSTTTNLVRLGAVLCALCFLFLFGCSPSSDCDITVSGEGSLCQIQYTDNDGNQHNLLVQSNSSVITVEDCDEVLSVDCS